MTRSLPLAFFTAVAPSSAAAAHVELGEPNGGEVLHAGDTLLVEWHVAVERALPATDCNANGVPDADDIAAGTSTDFDGDATPDEFQSFHVDVDAISVATGGAQAMTLAAGPAHAGELYLVAGSASGTAPARRTAAS